MGSRRPRFAGFGEDGGGRGGQAGRGGRGGFYSQQYQQGGRGAGSYHHHPQGAAHQPRGAMPAMQQWRPAGPAAQCLGHREVQPRHHNGGGGRGGHVGDGPSAAIAPDISASPEASSPLLEVVTEQLEVLSMEGGELSAGHEPIPSTRNSYKFPRRPGSGRIGIKCLVKANHFLAQLPDKDLHQYDVSITPEITSRVVGRAVMQELVKLHKVSYLGGRLPAYDGRNSMYTAGPLPFTSKEFHITLLDQDGGSGLERRGRIFKVVIRFAARVDLHRLEQYIDGKQAEAPQEALQVLDIVLRQLPTARYEPCGRSFFSPDLGRRRSLGDGIESWRGFYQTIRPTQMGLSLNINMSATSFFEPLPVIDFVAQLLNTAIHSRSLSDAERVKIKKALRGVKVEVTHRGNIRRTYRISGLTSQATRELSFPVDQGGTVKSVVQYFHETYDFSIKHTYLPCLQVGNQRRPNYLPMEGVPDQISCSLK